MTHMLYKGDLAQKLFENTIIHCSAGVWNMWLDFLLRLPPLHPMPILFTMIMRCVITGSKYLVTTPNHRLEMINCSMVDSPTSHYYVCRIHGYTREHITTFLKAFGYMLGIDARQKFRKILLKVTLKVYSM
jgi:hypothetical protein